MKPSSLLGHVVELLGDLNDSSLPADAVISSFFRDRRYLGSRDRRFIAETYYGVLRNRRLCDHLLETTGDVLVNVTDEGRSLLRISAYLLAVEPSTDIQIRDILEFIGEDTSAERLRQALALLSSRDPLALDALPDGLRWSFPDWMVERFTEEYGETTLPVLLRTMNTPAPLSLRVNMLATTVDACRQRLSDEGVPSEPGELAETCLVLGRRLNVFALTSFREGWFEVQDEGSQLLVQAADPKPTFRVLDMCAGAGGKTLAMSAHMKNRGEIVATDTSSYRLKELRKRMRRAGAGNIRIREDLLEQESTDTFDLVFVDAPCTGVGTIRRNPGMKWTVTEEMVGELAAKQTKILTRAATHVKPGGLLVYATCSMFKEENEEVVERFLRDHPAFAPESREAAPGVAGPAFRLDPHTHGTDGFYCAFLRLARGV